MASSTTSESQPSTNGALGGNKKPANNRSLSSQFGDMSPQEPCQPRQEVNSDIYKSANFARNCHSVYQNIRGPEMSGPGGSPARPVSSVYQLDGELPPPPPAAAQWTTASCANRNPADQESKGGKVDNSQDTLLSALKRTIEMREARFSSARDHSAPPRPK